MREVPKVVTDKGRGGGEQRHERGTNGGYRQGKGRGRPEA